MYSLVVYGAPYSSEAAATALDFARAALNRQHHIYRLFFFAEGVLNANRLAAVSQDEVNLQRQWHQLIEEHAVDSVVCVSSAIRRGILDRNESARHEHDAVTLYESSTIGGLGQLVDALLNSDRLVNFG